MPMPSLRRKPVPAPPPRKVHVGNQTAAAAVMNLEGVGWKDYKFGSSLWQVEGWRHYDRGGELHAVANVVANMASQCEIFIAKKVEGEAGKRADDSKVSVLSDQIYGGAEERPELVRLAALNLFVAGEYFNYIESAVGETTDRWMVLSVTQIKRAAGDPKLEFMRPHKYGGGKIAYWIPEGRDKAKDAARAKENTGVLIRTWTPHGQMPDHADSSVRSAIVVLNLIEQYDKRSSAQNDSRLAGAGIMFLPDSLDFPRGDDEEGATPGEALEARLGDAAGRTLKDPSNARSLVPIMATVNGDHIKDIKWQTFETPLDAETSARLDQCIRRLALSLDVPPEMLLGLGGMNHWGAWQAETSTHKTFVAPLLARICNALTEGWLQPLLKEMGLDPDEYMVWFDMSPLTVHANRLADAVQLYNLGLINGDAVLEAANFPKSSSHTPESFQRWLLTTTVLANPQLLSEPTIIAALGLKLAPPAGAGAPVQAVAGMPAGPAAIEAAPAAGPPQQPDATAQQLALLGAVEMAALHSLGIAGKRMLTRNVRTELMTEFAGRAFDLHTRLSVGGYEHAAQLLDGTWDLLPQLGARYGTAPAILKDILVYYCSAQMAAGQPHDSGTLTFLLSEGILAAAHRMCGAAGCVNQQHPQPCTAPLGVPA